MINQLIYMYDIKLFAKREKSIGDSNINIRIYNRDIGMEFGREKGVMLITSSGKDKEN